MKTKLFSAFKMLPGNTAGKGSDFEVGLMDGTTINCDILGLKYYLGLMAGTYGIYVYIYIYIYIYRERERERLGIIESFD